jgi:hypothetical protein
MIGGASAMDVSNIIIVVDGAKVSPGNTFELLGFTFNQRFTVRTYLANLLKEARFRASPVARLAQHLPRGQLLRQLGSGLLMGKLAHCLPVVAQPISEALYSIQIAINDVARSVVGCRIEDHITVKDLLESAKLVVKSTAMAAWSAYVSNKSKAGTRNPVGRLMFNRDLVVLRPTRATAAGEVRVPMRGVKTLVTHGLEIWNSCAELRDASTKDRAATILAKNSLL